MAAPAPAQANQPAPQTPSPAPPEYPRPITPALEAALREAERLLNQDSSFAHAREAFEALIEMAKAVGDDVTLLRGWNGLGGALWGLGDYGAAIAAYEEALPLCLATVPARCESPVLANIGNVLLSMSRHEEALRYFEQALAAKPPTPRNEATTLANMGIAHRFLGRYGRAKELLLRSLELRRNAGDTRGVGQSLNHLGMLSRAAGRYQEALDHYRESLALRREVGDRQGEAQTLNNIAAVHGELGQHEKAIEMYAAALETASGIGYAVQVGLSEKNIASNLTQLGRDADALPRLQAALGVFRKMDRRSMIGQTLLEIGQVHLRAGRLGEARAALDEALEFARTTREPELTASVLESSGNLLMRSGSADEALARLSEALALAVRGTPNIEYSVRASRARALRSLGRPSEALEELRASARIVNDLRAGLTSDAGKVGFLDSRRAVFEELADTLTQVGRHDEALEAAEAARARAFADLLMQRDVMARASESQALEAVRAAVDELRLQPAASSPQADAASRARGGDPLQAALASLRERNEELASLVAAESPRIGEIRRIAAGLGATAVEYLSTERRLLAWVVDGSGEVHSSQVDVPRARLVSLVKDVRDAMEGTDPSAVARPWRLVAALKELDRLLVAPVARWLPRSPQAPIVFVPDATLALVPLAALADGSGRTLVERYTISTAPALSVFRYSRARRRPLAAARATALVVADPLPPKGVGLGAIPASRIEGRLVARRLSSRRLLTGASASEAAVKRLAGDRSILHFATHGLVSGHRPLDSSLMLAEAEGEDGYLRAAEVFGLELRADLVVLSGCSTGVGPASGDGILGLTRAFLYAGTPSVVVSLWDVSDKATAVLMDRFYAHLSRGHGKASALRAAQLETKRRFPHPLFWAAFTLVGEPQ